MRLEELSEVDWMDGVRLNPLIPTSTTCRKTLPGTIIDFMIAAVNLMPRLALPVVDESLNLYPHRPVIYSLQAEQQEMWCRVLREPWALPQQPRPGCGRRPWERGRVMPDIVEAVESHDQSAAWDIVATGIEHEVLNLHDITGRRRAQPIEPAGVPPARLGRSGRGEAALCPRVGPGRGHLPEGGPLAPSGGAAATPCSPDTVTTGAAGDTISTIEYGQFAAAGRSP